MDESKHLLIIDEKNSPYETFLAVTGWTRVIFPNQPNVFEPDYVRTLLKQTDDSLSDWQVRVGSQGKHRSQPYDVILIDYDWLKKQDETLLLEFKEVGRPFIVIARGNPADGCEWAMVKGASGYIPEEKFDLQATRDEIIAILHHYKPPLERHGQDEKNLFEQYLTGMLEQSDICFLHWANFSGKRAKDVLSEEALNLLRYASNEELKAIVRAAIIQAQDDKADKIEKKHLPKRFLFPQRVSEQSSDFTNFLPAREFLEKVERQLGEGVSLPKIIQEFGLTEADFKTQLKRHWEAYAKRERCYNFRNICKAFPLRFVLFHGIDTHGHANRFEKYYFNTLRHDFELDVKVLYSLSGTSKFAYVYTDIENADGYLLFLCRTTTEFDSVALEVVTKQLTDKKGIRPAVFGVLLEQCDWRVAIRNTAGFHFFNLIAPLKELSDKELDQVYNRMAQKIRADIFDIWPP